MTKVNLDEKLTKFWEVEEVSRRPVISEGNKRCEEIFRSTTKRNAEGGYVVNLSFKGPASGPNRKMTYKKFLRNERSLKRSPMYKAQYSEVIEEYLSLAHMANIEDPSNGPSYNLPHHGVFKTDSTNTQLKVVFNASSMTPNGRSLNDNLYVGPKLQKDLVSIIMTWIFYEFVFSADITKMYRQILVNPDHTDYQRIVFRRSDDDEVVYYKLKTVTFGINCAPYFTLRTILQLADDEEARFPIGAKIQRDYMTRW